MSSRFAFFAIACVTLGSAAALAGTTITLVERATSDAVTDTGAAGDTVGDLYTWANAVYDAANQKKVGTDQGYCVRVEVGKSWECNWTVALADGQITVEGPFLDKGDSVLAITGGTGKYANARGQMKLHARDDKGSEYDFVYELQ
jgi:allene oxide cyclase